MIVVGPEPNWTCTTGELASVWRLSPARPTSPRGPTWYHGAPELAGKSGSLIGVFANGTRTLLVHALRARFSLSSGTELRWRRASAGMVGRRSATSPRSSCGRIRSRSCVTVGIDALRAGSDDLVPGR